MANAEIYDDSRPDFYQVNTHAQGPAGKLPLTPEILKDSPSGDLFGMTQNAGMGWKPDEVNNDNVLIMSTMGGLRDANGNPVALGFKRWVTFPLPHMYLTHVMVDPRGQRECLTRYRIEMMLPRLWEGLFGRSRNELQLWAFPHVIKGFLQR